MQILGITMLCIGALIGLIFGIQILVAAFRTSIWWGLGSLFVPIVGLIFIIVHWSVAKRPFLLSLIALPFVVLGTVLMRVTT
jgi:hypothetical protein